MVALVCLHILLPHHHHCADVYEGTASKMFVKYILLSVCLRFSKFSQVSFVYYMGLCVFNLPIPLMMIAKMCILYLIIIIKSEVRPICHCLGLGHETMVCAVCLSICLWWCQWAKLIGLLIPRDINQPISFALWLHHGGWSEGWLES